MHEADHSPEEAKSMGKSIQHKILIKIAPRKILPALCIFILDFAWIVHNSSSPVWGSKEMSNIQNILPILPAQTAPFTIPNTFPYLLVVFLHSKLLQKELLLPHFSLSISFQKANIGSKGNMPLAF